MAVGANVPVPLVVQSTEAALVTTPESVYDPAVVQIVASAPAFTLGAPVMVSIIELTAFAQVPSPVAVRVRVTDPEAISAGHGL